MALLLTTCMKVVDQIAVSIEHLPLGYTFIHSLPQQGKKSRHVAQRKWAGYILDGLFPPFLKQAMLLACLTPEGKCDTRGLRLYWWMVKYFYSNSESKLYKEWLQVKGLVK